jgi:hypothetical protein
MGAAQASTVQWTSVEIEPEEGRVGLFRLTRALCYSHLLIWNKGRVKLWYSLLHPLSSVYKKFQRKLVVLIA